MALIYKIVSARQWQAALATDRFDGAAIDLSDGYIHFSAAHQAEETARRHFAGQNELLLVAFDADRLGPDLKWEPSRGSELFPHLYGPLNPAAALWAKALPWNGSSHEFPDGWHS